GTGRMHFDLVREMTEQGFDEQVGNQVGLSFSPPLDGGDCDFSIPAVPRASILDPENEQRAWLTAALNSTEPTAYGAGEHSLVDAYHAARTRLGSASPAAIVLITEGEWDLLEGCGNPPT